MKIFTARGVNNLPLFSNFVRIKRREPQHEKTIYTCNNAFHIPHFCTKYKFRYLFFQSDNED